MTEPRVAPEPAIPPEIIQKAIDAAAKARGHSSTRSTWEGASVLHGLKAVFIAEALAVGDPSVSDEMLLVEVRKAVKAARLALGEASALHRDGMDGVVAGWLRQAELSPEEDALRQEGTALMWVRIVSDWIEMGSWSEAQWLRAEIDEARDGLARSTKPEDRAHFAGRLADREARLAEELEFEKAAGELSENV